MTFLKRKQTKVFSSKRASVLETLLIDIILQEIAAERERERERERHGVEKVREREREMARKNFAIKSERQR